MSEQAKRLILDGIDVSKDVKAMVGSVNINDPKSNYYRVFKQLLLIEEHIATKALNCRFCCFKHSSTAVALLEEVSQLDGRQLYLPMNNQLHGMLDGIPWRFTVHDGSGPTDCEYASILKDVRAARKYLMEMYFFPQKVEAYPASQSTSIGSFNPPGSPVVYQYNGPSQSPLGPYLHRY
jgi:hypothetical protein